MNSQEIRANLWHKAKPENGYKRQEDNLTKQYDDTVLYTHQVVAS